MCGIAGFFQANHAGAGPDQARAAVAAMTRAMAHRGPDGSGSEIVSDSPTAAEDYAEEITDLFGPSLTLARQRRVELLDHYAAGRLPGAEALRRSWIAYGDYWRRDTMKTEAREPA